MVAPMTSVIIDAYWNGYNHSQRRIWGRRELKRAEGVRGIVDWGLLIRGTGEMNREDGREFQESDKIAIKRGSSDD